MGDDVGATVRLGRDGAAAGWTLVAAFVVLGVGCAGLGVANRTLLALQSTFLLLGTSAVLAVRLTRLGGDHALLDADGIEVSTGGRTERVAWDDVLEIGVSGYGAFAGFWNPGVTLYVRPDGSTWDVPGPNALVVALLPVFGCRARRRLRGRLRAACEQHGVPFDPQGARMAAQPRPGSPYRIRPPGGRRNPARE